MLYFRDPGYKSKDYFLRSSLCNPTSLFYIGHRSGDQSGTIFPKGFGKSKPWIQELEFENWFLDFEAFQTISALNHHLDSTVPSAYLAKRLCERG
jgi:hypothetical protein